MVNAQSIKVLVVDDEPDIVGLLQYNLASQGYEVETAYDGEEALKNADIFLPHIILLDIMMPGRDGIQVCNELRKKNRLTKTHIIFLTARIEEDSEVAGFSAGADDYITKPIKPRSLLSRIHSVVKRKFSGEEGEKDILNHGELVVDKSTYQATYKGEKLHLARKEFEMLHLMASQPGRAFSREEIFDKVWGDDVFVGDRTIDVHIRKIREKTDPTFISTIKGIGYRFESPDE